MIRCTECYQQVVIKNDDRVYAIEDGKIASPVCKLVMSRPIGHIPDGLMYQEESNNG